MDQQWVTFRRVEIRRQEAPGIQGRTVRNRDPQELRTHGHQGIQFGTQGVVADERTHDGVVGQADEVDHRGSAETGIGMEGPTGLRVAMVGMRADLLGRRDTHELARAIQGDAVEVPLRGVIRRSNEIEVTTLHVHARDAEDIILPRGEQTGLPASRGDAVKVPPTVAFAQPQETRAAIDPGHLVHDFHPGVVSVREEDFRGAGNRVARDDVVGVLEAIELLEEDAAGIRGPLHARDVMVPGIGVRGEPTRRAAGGVDDADLARGVRLPDLGIGEGRELRVKAVRVVDEREFAHARGVELPISNVLAVGAPSQAVAQAEFFFVHPIGGAVDGMRAAIGAQREDAEVHERLHVHVVLVHIRDAPAIR